MQHNFVALLIGGVNRGEPARNGMAVVLVLLGHVTLGDGLQFGGSDEDVAIGGDGAERDEPGHVGHVDDVLENDPVPARRDDVELRPIAPLIW